MFDVDNINQKSIFCHLSIPTIIHNSIADSFSNLLYTISEYNYEGVFIPVCDGLDCKQSKLIILFLFKYY